MSSDHFERQAQFILEQQAKFEVAIAKLEENIATLAEQNRQNTINIAKIGDVVLSLAHYNEGQDERIAAHDRLIAENERQIAENQKQIAALIERGKETDERLNVLIMVVERYYGGNGDKARE